tara:strand:- start:26 stop:604 length:579 start_codon:yes stop_codon:yes gene_type:complete
MRVFILILVLIFSLQSWTNADDVRDFEIEGMSIGDSLLDHFSKDEIDNFTIDYYPKSKKFFVRDNESSKYKIYEGVQFALKKNSYKIYGIGGTLFSLENYDDCLIHKERVEKEISDIFEGLHKFSADGVHTGDPSGKSYHHQTQYIFPEGGVIAIECIDWSEEMTKKYNWTDNFNLSIFSKEYENFVRKEAY